MFYRGAVDASTHIVLVCKLREMSLQQVLLVVSMPVHAASC
jgi:hypothetical protein